MENVNDILVNYKKIPYEFYEWNNNDNIIHVKNMKVFKVSDECMYDFLNYEIKISKKIFKEINEEYNTTNKNKHLNVFIIFNDELCLSVLLDSDGKIIGKSKLLYEEQDDIIKRFNNLNEKKINYKVISKSKYNKYFTRYKIELTDNLKKYITYLYKNNSLDELKYLYYDCFFENNDNINEIYNKIIKNIEENNIFVISKLRKYIKYVKNSIN